MQKADERSAGFSLLGGKEERASSRCLNADGSPGCVFDDMDVVIVLHEAKSGFIHYSLREKLTLARQVRNPIALC